MNIIISSQCPENFSIQKDLALALGGILWCGEENCFFFKEMLTHSKPFQFAENSSLNLHLLNNKLTQ